MEEELTAELVSELIEAVRARPVIYDKRNGSYYSKALRVKAWEEVASSVGKDSSCCQKKWKHLRERFTKELKKRRRSSASSFDSSSWCFYHNLLFLKDHVEPKNKNRKESETDPSNEQTLNLSFDESDHSEVKSPPEKKAKGVDSAIEAYKKTLKIVEEKIVAATNSSRLDEADEMFGRTIAAHLKNLPERVKLDLKQQIFTLVLDTRKAYVPSFSKT